MKALPDDRQILAVLAMQVVAAGLVVAVVAVATSLQSDDAAARRPTEGTAVAEPPAAAPTSPFTVYLDPEGADSHNGMTPKTAVQSLARALDVLADAKPDTDVEIRIAPGTYTAPPLTWTFFRPGRTITFLPLANEDDTTAEEDRPIFQGTGDPGFWFWAALPPSLAGTGTRLRFFNLRIQGYDRGAIFLSGGYSDESGLRTPRSEGFNGNTITGMYFTQLGSTWVPGGRPGYAAVDLVNSSDNVIRNNHFVALENVPPGESLMHGVYLAHHSRGNVVRDNQFQTISGDPIRARDDSNDNEIFANAFERTGQSAQFSDWFCDPSCANATGHARECASHGNLFHSNINISGYTGGRLRNWAVSPGGLDYTGGSGCDNAGQPRVRTWGNQT